MTWRSFIILLCLSACASTVWKNDPETPPVKYSDQLINYESLTEEVILTLKKYISQELIELIDHSNNASNKSFADTLRSYSKERVRTILNLDMRKGKQLEIEALINEIGKTSLDQIQINSPEMKNDSTFFSDIYLDGRAFIKARIKRKLKIFSPDTLKVWEVDFIVPETDEF